MSVSGLINRLSNIGTHGEGTPLTIIKRIRMLNRVICIFMVTILVKWVSELILFDWIGLGVASLLLVLLGLVLYLNAKEKYHLARDYSFILFILILTALTVLFGRGYGVEFVYFPVFMVVVNLVEKRRVQLRWFLLAVFFYALGQVYVHYNEPLLLENLSENTYYLNLSCCALAVLAVSMFFVSENRAFENRTKELLDDLQQKNTNLERANGDLERFAFLVSHDLKTPLRNITSFLGLSRKRLATGKTEDVDGYMVIAEENAIRLHTLVQDILELSRLRDPGVTYEYQELDSIMDEVRKNLYDIIDEKSAQLRIAPLPLLYGNYLQLSSLFQNLIENGIKYNMSENPWVRVWYETEGERCHIFIQDNGLGIPEAYRDRIFDMFYRLHAQDKIPGTGIGLSTCKKIVELMGGTLEIHTTTEEIGTTFVLDLPMSVIREAV